MDDKTESTVKVTGQAAATAEHNRRAAFRAVDDPVKLARAARIVRAALARKKISLADLTPLPEHRPIS